MIKKVIGITGNAGAGKDLLCEMLLERLGNSHRFALADELKEEIAPWCRTQYGIDPRNCTREEKSLIRDFLVFHGNFKRDKTQGRYWTELLGNEIRSYACDYSIVTDIRYSQYERDEDYWLKKEMNGVLVHLSSYHLESVQLNGGESFKTKKWTPPANEHEKRNYPTLRERADYHIEWEIQTGNREEIKVKLASYADDLVNFLLKFY